MWLIFVFFLASGSELMRVVVFGTGAMGCLFGARLGSVAEVTLVGTWVDAIAAIRERGILIEDAQAVTGRVQAAYLGMPLPPADLALILIK